jgi:zinc transporter ZupT
VWLTGVSALARRIVPFSGGVLLGVAAFWVLPETARALQWTGAAACFLAGILLLWVIDRYVHPVCPTCSHSHDHDHCATRLHGFATPLLVAAALHATLDGWSIAASKETLGVAVLVAIGLHKIPEGLALGVIARSALKSPAAALAGCAAAEAATIAGALLERVAAPFFGEVWIHGLLALAGGSFLYLGYHAVHNEVQQRGVPAMMPAFAGVAGTSVIRFLAR